MEVTYLPEGSTPEPLAVLYLAYKGTVSRKALHQLAADVATGAVRPDEILAFVQEQAAIGHTSPWHMVFASFAIEGISRACSAQLLRHHVGVSFEERSLRAVDGGNLPAVEPPSVEAAGQDDEWPPFRAAVGIAHAGYRDLVEDGVPREDARYVLPLATETAVLMTASLSALLHMADERLCHAAQWEIRQTFIALRHAYVAAVPALGRLLAPKCAPHRFQRCDEPLNRWRTCPLGGLNGVVRPHVTMVEELIRERWGAQSSKDALPEGASIYHGQHDLAGAAERQNGSSLS